MCKEKKLKFTLHALFRQMTRIESLTEEKLEQMIVSGYAIDIGEEKGTNRIHYLFYCIEESNFYVAIADMRTYEVVTIIPGSYHDEISWVIGEPFKKMALDKAYPPESDVSATPTSNKVKVVADSMSVSIETKSSRGVSNTTSYVRDYQISIVGSDPFEVIKNAQVLHDIKEIMQHLDVSLEITHRVKIRKLTQGEKAMFFSLPQ